MARGPRREEVRAAGGVLRRVGPDSEPQVAVIHRPRYDDWSLPKGKLEPGEEFQEAAEREVEEETGFRVALGREIGESAYRDCHGRPKVVRYWLMTPLGGRFLPDREVDKLEWLSYDAARQRLTHDRDREILAAADGSGNSHAAAEVVAAEAPTVEAAAVEAPPEPPAPEPPAPDGRRNPPSEELYARKWKIFAVTMVGLFMALIDVTIVNITIPTLQRKLHAGVDTVSWVLNAYNIMFAVLLVSMGRLADQFGRKRFFLIGMSIFTIGSLLCALSPTIHWLIAFRVIQAVGAGILAPLALATTVIIFPPQQRGLGLALLAVVANTAAAIGPPLGGVLVEYASWHWIFLINVPIGIIGVLLAMRVMPETYDLQASRKIDLLGMALLGGAVASLTYGLVEANTKGWGSTEIVSLFVLSALLTAGFALSQRYGRFPMLTRALTRNRQFVGASSAFVLFAMGVMGVLFLLVIAFQNMWGYSPLTAAFAIGPIPLVGLCVAPLVGRIADRTQPRIIAGASLLFMAAGLFWVSHLPAHPDYTRVLPALVLMGVGMGASFPALSVGSMGSVPGQEVGLASGIVNMARQLGFALGIAVLVAVFTGAINNNIPKAKAQAVQITRAARIPPARAQRLFRRAFANPNDTQYRRFVPHTRIQHAVGNVAVNVARDSYSDAFRVAALCELLAIPFALTMRRSPQQVQAQARAAAEATA